MFFLKVTFMAFLFMAYVNVVVSEDNLPVYQFKGRKIILQKYWPLKYSKPALKEIDYSWSLPVKVSLKRYQTSIKDQSNRGSCSFFAATALLESLIKKIQNIDINISEEYLIFYTKSVLKRSPEKENSDVEDALAGLKDGFLLEGNFPYHPSWFVKGLPCGKYSRNGSDTPLRCFSHNAPPLNILAKKIVDLEFKTYDVLCHSNLIIREIAENKRPVITNLPVHPDGWNDFTGTVIHNEQLKKDCDDNPNKCGKHAILLIGYDQKKKEFLFKNSWGKYWGNAGYGTVPFEVINKYGDWTYTGDLEEKIEFLEPNHSTASPSVKNANIKISKDKNVISTFFHGEIKNFNNAALYISTYLVHKKHGVKKRVAPNDDNISLLEVPPTHQMEYGKYVKGAFYKLIDEKGETIFNKKNPVKMAIPYLIVDKSKFEGLQTYLRISVYIHGDQDNWEKVARFYKEITL